MDFDKIAQSLLPLLGGKENIASAAHCATRLRLVLVDDTLADQHAIGPVSYTHLDVYKRQLMVHAASAINPSNSSAPNICTYDHKPVDSTDKTCLLYTSDVAEVCWVIIPVLSFSNIRMSPGFMLPFSPSSSLEINSYLKTKIGFS